MQSNMNEIHDFTNTFDFDKLFLTSPVISSGGNYYIKYVLTNDNPLYIQPPKCTTKQGLVKTNGGKKMYCDLVFSNTNEEFIKWIEDLEKYSQEYIFKNREKWFESKLEMEDIENSFAPSLKIFKSGKMYVLRTIVPTHLGKCNLKIFNENETEFNIDDFNETTNVITILEIQGIKCSSKSFQIDIEIKQMMVLKPNILFEKCIIKKSNLNDETNEPKISSDAINVEPVKTQITDGLKNNISIVTTEIEDFHKRTNDIEEINLVLDDTLQENNIVTLKNRKELYYNIYKEAIKNAKEARNLAINSFLEAKQIKKLYFLEELDEDDELIEENFFNFNNLEK